MQEPINALEKRALNFLVHEYLIQHDNKLTSITFSEENADQVRRGRMRGGGAQVRRGRMRGGGAQNADQVRRGRMRGGGA